MKLHQNGITSSALSRIDKFSIFSREFPLNILKSCIRQQEENNPGGEPGLRR